MKMKVDITFEYHWGYRYLHFTKGFELPFAPFFGLTILDEDEDGVNSFDDEEFKILIDELYGKS